MHRRKIFLRLKRFCRFVINCILNRAYHTGKDYNSCGRKQNKAYFLNESFLLTNFSASNAWPFIITICCSTNYERLMQHNILNLACILQCVHTLFLYIDGVPVHHDQRRIGRSSGSNELPEVQIPPILRHQAGDTVRIS